MPRQSQFSITVSSAGRVPRASHSQSVTAQRATQQAPNASALKPNAPVVTPTTCGFSLIAVSVSAACTRRIVSHICEV